MKLDHTILDMESIQTPAYVYDLKAIKKNAQTLQEAFAEHQIYYSIKANPNLQVCQVLSELGLEAEVVTKGELLIAQKAGFSVDKMLYAGPAKIKEELRLAIQLGVRLFTAESVNQLMMIDRLSNEENSKVNILLRINAPELQNNECESMMGVTSHFGQDIESFMNSSLQINQMKNVKVIGTQFYSGSQILDPTWLAKSVTQQIIMTKKLQTVIPLELKMLDIGGGFGIPYKAHEKPMEIKRCADLVNAEVKKRLEKEVKILVESGRYITGNTGVFLTKIVDIKSSFGKNYVVCDGGMVGFTRPILTREKHRIRPMRDEHSGELQNYIVCGSSCSSLDSLGAVDLAEPKIGDILIISDAGAYGLSMSITSFHCQAAPIEITY